MDLRDVLFWLLVGVVPILTCAAAIPSQYSRPIMESFKTGRAPLAILGIIAVVALGLFIYFYWYDLLLIVGLFLPH